MLFDISLLMASHIKSVREAGEYLYRLDCMEGLTRKELERLLEILIHIDEEYRIQFDESGNEEVSSYF